VNCQKVPCDLYMLYASNGDPLLLFGLDKTGSMMLWPTCYIGRHPIAFAKWCKRQVAYYRGTRMILNHPITPEALKWGRWLGAKIEEGVAVV
jgi:hypothetical protein